MSEYYPAFLRQGYDDIDFLFAAGELQSRAQIVTTTSEKEQRERELTTCLSAPLSAPSSHLPSLPPPGGLSEADCSALQIQLSGHRRKVASAYGLKPYTTQGGCLAMTRRQLACARPPPPPPLPPPPAQRC